LLRWSKETGGGDGNSESFQRYCGNKTWLGWVYLLDEENAFLLSGNCQVSVPENLRNESGVDAKSTGKKGRLDVASENMLKLLQESKNERKELTIQLFGKFDAIVDRMPNVVVDKSKALRDEEKEITKALLAERRMIRDEEKEITMDASMDADEKAAFLELLNHRKEAMDKEVFAFNDEKKKRKASELECE
jgi:hypothetical protein